MANIAAARCAEKGFYFGASSIALHCLFGTKRFSHVLIQGVSNCAGITAGNYIVGNKPFFQGWERRTKVIAVLAITAFSSAIFWTGAKLFDKTINVQEKLVNEIGGLCLTYFIFGSKLYTAF